LPSRYGIKHLISNVFRPVAIQQQLQSDALNKLQLLSNSDIFWDEISQIEPIEPKEEWVYDLTIGETHNFIANGIIIHNSNFGDSVRFVMGEIALKALRARKVKDLIHTGAKSAEVTLNFDGDEKIEVKRAIREDGKILYKLNGKKTTRSMILDFMKKYNLDESGRNIIAQGEVARIINVNGKDRRQIIDAVAGISDFEQKKKESMRELGTVEERIKDANLVLGERQAFLKELEMEKESAIRYKGARTNLKNSKGTVLKMESERLTKELESARSLEEKIKFNVENKETDLAELEQSIAAKEKERHGTSRLLQEKQQTSSLVRKIEELKASLSSKSQLIADREELVAKGKNEFESISKEIELGANELHELEEQMEKIKNDIKELEPKVSDQQAIVNAEIETLRNTFNNLSDGLAKLKERSIALKADIKSKQEIVQIKKEEASRITGSVGEDIQDPTKEIERLRAAANDLSEQIEDSFKRTKEINVEIGELDKKMLDLKEQASIYKIRASPHLTNPALQLISSMKEKNAHGIHGTVADLIQFDPQYAHAVEAAAGGRLLYVVVDDMGVATGVIDKLKSAKAGRATFIPMMEVRTSRPMEMNGFSSILDVVKCNSNVRRAMEYVFGETLLVDSTKDAKEIGIGKCRIVTLDGEIFERSGIVSGGRASSSILGGNQLKKLESQIAQVKSTKDSLISELYSLRESESQSRARKSEFEIQIKTHEMELKAQSDEAEKRQSLLKTKSEIVSQIEKTIENIRSKENEYTAAQDEISKTSVRISEIKEKLDSETKRFEAESIATNKKQKDLASLLSSARATYEGKINEHEIRKREIREKEARAKEIEKERKDSLAKITELKRQMNNEQDELSALEEKVSGYSKEIEALFAKIKSFEEDLQLLGKQRGEKRIELDKFNKDLNQLEVKKATVSTRLEDVASEFSDFGEFEFQEEMKKDELMKIVKESEQIIASMPNVNMAAIEMYEKKKGEIEGVEEKIEMLGLERKAILEMISEIEQHKKDAFFKTFFEVSENFKKMFTYLSIGDGYLYLDKPNDPFESGLFIKLKRKGKDGKIHEHSIDSLSGGENSLVALMFIFAMQFFKPAPFYILDEIDAALDKENSKNLAQLISNMAKNTQFILVSHNDIVMATADSVLGVTRVAGVSKLVGVKLESKAG
jgi:chromosome segregation protein